VSRCDEGLDREDHGQQGQLTRTAKVLALAEQCRCRVVLVAPEVHDGAVGYEEATRNRGLTHDYQKVAKRDQVLGTDQGADPVARVAQVSGPV
jgi:hypothetical protein